MTEPLVEIANHLRGPIKTGEPVQLTELEDKDADLGQLAERIRTAMGRVVKHAADTVMAAMDAGDALIKAKRKLAHGDWMDWLEKNCALSDRTARVYIQLAEGREIIEEQIKAATELAVIANFSLGVSANFTITRALGWLKDEKTNVISTSAKGKLTRGSRKKEEPQHLIEITPEDLLTSLVSNWPPAKVIKLGELITAKFQPCHCGWSGLPHYSPVPDIPSLRPRARVSRA